ncbi:MAG TPA: hypothetical protein VK857_09070 [Desulforhopalus sp.]|nr:hypothetical protein [Desulforhopalus sp.]
MILANLMQTNSDSHWAAGRLIAAPFSDHIHTAAEPTDTICQSAAFFCHIGQAFGRKVSLAVEQKERHKGRMNLW